MATISPNCESCGARKGITERCEYCGALYPVAVQPDSAINTMRSLDAKYRVERGDSQVTISWHWRNTALFFFIPFAVFFLVLSLSMTGKLHGSFDQIFDNPLALFPIPGLHLLIAVLILLFCVVNLINKTTIRADRQTLSIRHHPLPVKKNHRFATSQIQQIFVSKSHRTQKKRTWEVPILQLITQDGRRHRLMKGDSEVEFADYEVLRRHLLKAMGIQPTRVHGASE